MGVLRKNKRFPIFINKIVDNMVSESPQTGTPLIYLYLSGFSMTYPNFRGLSCFARIAIFVNAPLFPTEIEGMWYGRFSYTIFIQYVVCITTGI